MDRALKKHLSVLYIDIDGDATAGSREGWEVEGILEDKGILVLAVVVEEAAHSLAVDPVEQVADSTLIEVVDSIPTVVVDIAPAAVVDSARTAVDCSGPTAVVDSTPNAKGSDLRMWEGKD